VQLFVKIVPLKAGSAEAAGDEEVIPCPPDVEPDTILSFLAQKFGELIDTAWTSTERHPRLETGWIFPGTSAVPPMEAIEFLCVPFIQAADGSLQSMFELLADQRQEFDQLAKSRAVDEYVVIEQPQRAYRSSAGGHAQRDALIEHAGNSEVGRTMDKVTLRDEVDGGERRYLGAHLDETGSLVIDGQDLGPSTAPVSSDGEYEWWVTISAQHIPQLLALLDAPPASDILEVLAENWTGTRSHELERRIRESGIPHQFSSYS
jgi:hypothetical protein